MRDEHEKVDTPDLANVHLTHYRLQKQREQDHQRNDAKGDELLHPGGEFGTGQAREKQLEPLSLIIARMNDLFSAENLSDGGMLSYATTFAAKIQENAGVMAQVRNHSADQAMLGDFRNPWKKVCSPVVTRTTNSWPNSSPARPCRPALPGFSWKCSANQREAQPCEEAIADSFALPDRGSFLSGQMPFSGKKDRK